MVHARFKPRAHRLVYRLFWFCLDLAALETSLPSGGWLGRGTWSLYRFCDEDHLCIPEYGGLTTRQKLIRYLQAKGIHWDGSRSVLVTQLRFLGYVFNPVSFYFCWNADGTPAAAVAEVGNTYGEMKLYAMGPAELEEGVFRLRVPKYFYVSPFTDLTTEFEFRLDPPGDVLRCDVDDFKDGERILMATVQGARKNLEIRQLFWMTLRFPFVTLGIIFLIHWNALLIFLKRVPYFPKDYGPGDQREVLRKRV